MQSEPGIRVTGYRIEARIGRGGMGEVYRAEQLSLGRKVALKVLRPDLAADDGFRRRFLRESMIAAGIDHPNVIPIYDAGEVDGLLYIAMRYVDGSDLSTLLRREGRLDLALTLAIMTQVAGALDAAHAHGLVHRDVKPSNILLAPAAGGGEYCYLCDFGLIKQLHADTAATATDQLVGSVPYVAPEQVAGEEVDGRTDVYSLGCSIFRCLAGSALVAAAAAQVPAGGRVRAPLVDDETRSIVRPPAPAAAATLPAPFPAAPPPGGRRGRGRWLLGGVALLLVAGGAYLAAAELMARTGSPPPPSARTAPATTGTATGITATSGGTAACAWTEPTPGTQDRQKPLDAMRAKLGVNGAFAGVEMRLFTGPGGLKRWSVKAYQERDQKVRGRWLLDEQPGGPPQVVRVVAEADYDTRGYRRADWRAVGGDAPGPADALAACLDGT
jgi:hypothetical protein